MLTRLKLEFVGPSREMCLEFSPRLNLLTGDNSLGKTFVLDVAWWALTQTWYEQPGQEPQIAWPLPGHRKDASISYSFEAKTVPVSSASTFNPETEEWPLRRGRPGNPGLVLYLRVDGGFSLWDPARNYWKRIASRDYEAPERPKAFHFSLSDVWNGLRTNGSVLCEGLLSDWRTWKDRSAEEYGLLCEVLKGLSPHHEKMGPGDLIRVSVNDVRDIPTIRTAYGDVPVTLASAGMRRVLGLAYLIAWAHTEHLKACQLVGDDPTDRFTILIDEVEAHLHPQWQRVLLPSVLKVVQRLGREGAVLSGGLFPQVQVLASTHAPLVMASIEPEFTEELDRVFHFKVENGDIGIETLPWAPQGDAVGWLVSETFGLEQARSIEAERAIEAAEAYMRGDSRALPVDLKSREAIHEELKRVVAGHDPFWPRWIVQTENDS